MQSHYCHSLKPDNPETIVQDEFSEIMITVLPDHTPGDLFVHPFQAALNSLLLKPELMQQSTFSLPNVHNSFSFINNPAVNKITELYHGSWWADRIGTRSLFLLITSKTCKEVWRLHFGLFEVSVQKPLCFLIFLGTSEPIRYQ